MTTKIKRGIVTAICVALGSQVSVSVLTDGFIIAMAVVVLGVLMYSYNIMHPFYTGLLVAMVSPTFRAISILIRENIQPMSSRVQLAILWTYPEVGFYITYGLTFYLFYRITRKEKNMKNYFFCLLLSDFFANMVEMLLRYEGKFPPSQDVSSLAIIAVIRSALICVILVAVDLYKSLLSKEEHEERYKKLMIMVSVFRSEIYFMNKNMAEIEDIMKKAFRMYKTMEDGEYPEPIKEMSLDIAKDVHEIKKDYIRVIKGLQENFLAEMDVDKISIRDIVSILDMDIKERIAAKKVNAHFVTSVRANFMVTEHFSLMSVLRNLAVNALDAVAESGRPGLVQLEVRENVDKRCFEIIVEDNGTGIRKKDIDVIFDAGYSTKFDGETGNINRGVGLTMVRDLVRDRFHGTVEVESEEGIGTKFKVCIPFENVTR